MEGEFMVRKLFIVGALAALPLGFLIRANSAWAGPPPIDVSNDKINCNTVIGSVKIKPALVNGGVAGATDIKVKGTLDGCTDTTNGAVIIHASKFKGELTGTSNDCATLLSASSVTGSITVKWKADSTTPITPNTSTLTPGTLTGGTFAPAALAPATYGDFTIGSGATVSGAFTGGDGGATTHAVLATGQDVGALGTACAGAGIKAITIGLGTLTLQ
jgi:hypothetical protein